MYIMYKNKYTTVDSIHLVLLACAFVCVCVCVCVSVVWSLTGVTAFKTVQDGEAS